MAHTPGRMDKNSCHNNLSKTLKASWPAAGRAPRLPLCVQKEIIFANAQSQHGFIAVAVFYVYKMRSV